MHQCPSCTIINEWSHWIAWRSSNKTRKCIHFYTCYLSCVNDVVSICMSVGLENGLRLQYYLILRLVGCYEQWWVKRSWLTENKELNTFKWGTAIPNYSYDRERGTKTCISISLKGGRENNISLNLLSRILNNNNLNRGPWCKLSRMTRWLFSKSVFRYCNYSSRWISSHRVPKRTSQPTSWIHQPEIIDMHINTLNKIITGNNFRLTWST